MALRFLGADGSGGSTSDAMRALEYALSFGVRISSNSWGGPETSDALRAVVQRAGEVGHLFVTAAGNGGSDVGDGSYFPCAYQKVGALCVAATTQTDQLASFSNYATEYVEIAAPGVDIISTFLEKPLTGRHGSGYKSQFGTSMAVPFVSGAAALAASSFDLDGAVLRRLLIDSARSVPALEGKVGGAGRLDVRNLVLQAESHYLFWLEVSGQHAAQMSATIPANGSLSVWLRVGAESAAHGSHEASVHVAWANGTENVPVVYTYQGWPELQQQPELLEWPQVPVNATVDLSLNVTNLGNGTGRLRVKHLAFPFLNHGAENVTVAPGRSAQLRIGCAPNATGTFAGQAVLQSNSGLDPWSSVQADALEFGTVLNVSLLCTSAAPPYLEMEPFTGAAEVISATQLRAFDSVVHAEWEPLLPPGEVEAELVLPEANNSFGCAPYTSEVGGVALVRRGGCYFLLKAQMAQAAGALGVLLYDNQGPTTTPMLAMPKGGDVPDIPMFMVTQALGEDLAVRLPRVVLRWAPVRVYTSRPPTAPPASVEISISNLGSASLTWEGQPRLSFGASQDSFYTPSVSSSGFSWAELPEGSEIGLFPELNVDDGKFLYTLPFSFSFYGQMFDEVWVCSNGFLAFDAAESGAVRFALPFQRNPQQPNGIVAPFAWDLVCGTCTISAGESTDTGGCAIVQFTDMSFFDKGSIHNAGSDLVSFEVRLCRDGRIHFMYAAFPQPAAGYENAFVGLESMEGDSAIGIRSQLPFAEGKPFSVTLHPWVTAAAATRGQLVANQRAVLRYDVRSTTGYGGFIQLRAQDESGLWHSERKLRLAQDPFQFELIPGDWGPCLVQDCSNFSLGERTRHFQCQGMDGNFYSTDLCDTLCVDLLADWRDKDGESCAAYGSRGWCSDGSYGAGWPASWGAFSDHAFGGYDASMACCACGGGVRRQRPASSEMCENNVVAVDTDCDGLIDCDDSCPLDPSPMCTTGTSSSYWAQSSTSTSHSNTWTATRTTSHTATSLTTTTTLTLTMTWTTVTGTTTATTWTTVSLTTTTTTRKPAIEVMSWAPNATTQTTTTTSTTYTLSSTSTTNVCTVIVSSTSSTTITTTTVTATATSTSTQRRLNQDDTSSSPCVGCAWAFGMLWSCALLAA
ncbi:unnamed protein product [Effrenium voratum]|uniref:subtilisin n=1 Tax=Effrenium voratum TaxID=2562239 RepID=A0AA36HZL7_9DINO|nr:unnamed protein product [Effrenium voratum]